ncbi:hypothetical protein ACGGZK_01820 [Agromyces sp. MMS24-K17]|uniref:hypothetical protein n=1 Tax=Agromyces sp. MMS24-K17 TaxID=3372850 RepID=UPI003754274B
MTTSDHFSVCRAFPKGIARSSRYSPFPRLRRQSISLLSDRRRASTLRRLRSRSHAIQNGIWTTITIASNSQGSHTGASLNAQGTFTWAFFPIVACERETLERAEEDRRIASTPARGVNLPRKAPKKRVCLSHGQVALLAGHPGECGTLVRVLSYTGLRRGEATALRVRDLDLLRLLIAVNGGERRGGNPTSRPTAAPRGGLLSPGDPN